MPIDPKRETWKPGMPWEKALEDIEYITGLGREMGGAERIGRQHKGGRYTVRERLAKILDSVSFVEYGPMIGAAEYDDEGNLIEFSPGAYVMGLGDMHGLIDLIEEGIDSILWQVNKQMSTWDPESEISKFNAWKSEKPYSVSEPLINVINHSMDISRKTNGLFDITVYELMRLWGFGPNPKYEMPKNDVTKISYN